MKKILFIVLSLIVVSAFASCDEKIVTYDQLPSAAKSFVKAYFPDATVSHTTKDDDLIRPDYEVLLSDGTSLEFSNSGELKKVSSKNGIPADIVPESIRNYVDAHYPGAGFIEYEIGRRTYEVTLTNRLEFKFNSNFEVIEVDD